MPWQFKSPSRHSLNAVGVHRSRMGWIEWKVHQVLVKDEDLTFGKSRKQLTDFMVHWSNDSLERNRSCGCHLIGETLVLKVQGATSSVHLSLGVCTSIRWIGDCPWTLAQKGALGPLYMVWVIQTAVPGSPLKLQQNWGELVALN